MNSLKVKKGDIAHLLRETFPDYTGRKFRVEARESMTLRDLNWSGGTRSSYAVVTLDGQAVGNTDDVALRHPMHNVHVEGASVPMRPGMVIAEHSIFCGVDLGVTFYVHPSNLQGNLLAQ